MSSTTTKEIKHTEVHTDAGSIFIGDPVYIDIIQKDIGKNGCFEDYKYIKALYENKSSDTCPVSEMCNDKKENGIGLLIGNSDGNTIPIKVIKKYTNDENESLGVKITITITEFNDDK
jgi:hypothetical protein